MPGPAKKPKALRELHGTANRNKHRDVQNQPEPTDSIGPPPDRLPASHKEIWHEIRSTLYEGVLGEGDAVAFEMLVNLTFMMRFNFEDMTAAHMSNLRALLGQFGMTPADRTRITVPEKKKENEFMGLAAVN